MTFAPQAVRAFEHAGWQRAAAGYEETFARATAPFLAPLLDAAEISPGLRVLDVACGPGHAAAAAAERGATAQGLDFSAAMVGIARARHPEIAIEEGDAEALPYADGAFDAIISNFGIHHVPRPDDALAEAHRVLADDGRMAFTVWAEPGENVAWRLVFDAVAHHGDRAAARTPPPGGSFNRVEDCRRALERAGFTDVSARIVRAEWPLANAPALLAALSAGTVRMAALLAAQEASALAAIRADIAREAERYRTGDQLALPIAAVLARGRKNAQPLGEQLEE
jgi:SAM-dependent methyltransferase